MTLKQIAEDIAASTHVNPLNLFEEKLEELMRDAYIIDDWDRGWVAALQCVSGILTGVMKGDA